MSEPPVDSQDFNERTLGNARLQAELLGLFLEHSAALFESLEAGIRDGSPESAAKAAHRLAGSAATVSAKALHRQIRAIEDAITAGDADWAKAALPAAADTFTASLRQIERLRDRLK